MIESLIPADASDLLEPELLPYAVGVGALCNAWAKLESATRMLFLKVSGMPADRRGFGFVHCLDFRDLLTAIKLAFVDGATDHELTEFALGTISYIDAVLRNRRNRYVHDLWNVDVHTGDVETFRYGPRIFKAQSRKPREWTPFDIEPQTLDRLWLTVREIEQHTAMLRNLQPCFDGNLDAIAVLLATPPERRFLHPQPEKPSPSGT